MAGRQLWGRAEGGAPLEGRTALVVGLGASGVAAARLLAHLGATVLATDRALLDPQAEALSELTAQGVKFFLGGHDGVPWSGVDLIVVSPGVPPMPEWERAAAAGVSVISETELASRYLEAPLCAIGGTNGKSTVTTLLGEMLGSAGLRVFSGGNLGEPACAAPLRELDVAVFEVSSFQMERLEQFRPKVGVLLGVSEDHLDRYASYEAYVHAKGNCFSNQTETDVAIVPFGDEQCARQAARGRARVSTFGEGGDFSVSAEGVYERATGEVFSLEGADLHGRHNWSNAAAAVAAARALGLDAQAINEGLSRFRALPHRMALAGRVAGISFYDDSKATNVGAAVTALLGLTESKGVMILGGRDKQGSYESLATALSEKGRAVVLLGEAQDVIAKALEGVLPLVRANSMQEAVRLAFSTAKPGDAVLLSPACSSLDMYKNYAERGKRFIEAVLDLNESQKD